MAICLTLSYIAAQHRADLCGFRCYVGQCGVMTQIRLVGGEMNDQLDNDAMVSVQWGGGGQVRWAAPNIVIRGRVSELRMGV